jgi:hemerythrin superfamily protein
MASADAITLIEQDHRTMEALFERVVAGDGDRTALIDEISAMLTAHARAEELEVYPAIRRADPGEEPEVAHAYDEHHEAEHLLRSARNLVASPHFDEAFTAFVAAVSHHVEEEEQEILPALREAVDEATLRKLGEAFQRERDAILAELTPAAIRKPPVRKPPVRRPPAGTSTVTKAGTGRSAKGSGPPADATRDELYELAKEADIQGRSTMTKQELSEALRRNG